jgi:lipopolysaccharide kinase (Kdo/WaaP) family protein
VACRKAGRGEAGLPVSGRAWPEPPAGFVLRRSGNGALYVAAALEDSVRDRGLESWDAWARVLAAGSPASGRGSTAVIEGGRGSRWRVKAMRRGGRLAGIWRERHGSVRRLVATLSASAEAHARGVPTAPPVALIVEVGPFGLARGAMAVTEIEGSEDLARRVTRHAATRSDLDATMTAVRAMHDRGVLHPDLNLGNLLLRSGGGESPEVFVIDFDRATFAAGPLPFKCRQAALRRLERSCAKLTGAPGPLGPGSEDLWYSTYAAADADLGRRLARGRFWGRLALSAHRLGWR